MDQAELLEIYTRQQRIAVEYPDMRREVDGPVVRQVSLSGEDGFVIYSRLDEGDVEAAIEAQITRFGEIAQNFEWKAYDYDPPADLIERLRRRGFEIGASDALLALDLNAASPVMATPPPPSVVRIQAPGEVDALVALENAVWNDDYRRLGERLKRDLRDHPELLSVYLSYEGQEPAAAAWIYFHPGTRFGSLWGGSTLAPYRGRGHYTRLLAARAGEALARGFDLLTVDASPMSRPILERLGFQWLAASTECRWNFTTT